MTPSMDRSGLPPCAECGPVTPEAFQSEILRKGAPLILRGQVADWPAVQAGLISDRAMADYLLRVDTGRKVPMSLAMDWQDPLFFYDESLRGLNFRTGDQLIERVLERLLAAPDSPAGRELACYIQSISVLDHMPRFGLENELALIARDIVPRIWIGNRLQTQTHYDLSDNLACLVAGQRRFTLFPPEQLANLYPGPDDVTPGGAPVSLARLDGNDLERHPKLTEAMRHALRAELRPGDVLFIPYGWWHHVESQARFNVLVNYWWNSAASQAVPPGLALSAALLGFKTLPEAHKRVWKSLMDYYVFETSGDPLAHLPLDRRGSFDLDASGQVDRLMAQLTAFFTKRP